MTLYLSQFSYAAHSVKAMVDKPQERRSAAEKIFVAAGGKLIDMYFCFGEYDGLVITEFPSEVDVASAVLAVGSSGVFSKVHTTVLISTDDAVKAMEKAHGIAAAYKPPAT